MSALAFKHRFLEFVRRIRQRHDCTSNSNRQLIGSRNDPPDYNAQIGSAVEA
jgi:hypothetical protein